jgi:hypothetical protein
VAFSLSDFVIDRIPFRRWDVYRRKKHAVTTATYMQPNAPLGSTSGLVLTVLVATNV